ncbi:UNVERIFIED_CONTAM: hypothetical protein GTU68_051881, partial [Idotea baltica]|nr:hypothetical protein [Idotea baltica]
MQEGLRSKKFSAVELTEAHLAQIAKHNEALNGFVSVHHDESIEQARKADERLSKEAEKAAAMTGIPVAVKDAIVMKDSVTTNGSAILKNYRSPFDATVIHKLRKQDAVLIGKTNLDQFGMGSSTEHSIFGPSRNPHDVTRVAGGTSGGSAIAAASLQCAVALGADTGGSIRQPASFCGIYGLKPSYGRVSRYGLIAHASSFDQIGPMGRTAACVAEGFSAIAGHDPKDSTSVDEKLPSLTECTKESGEDLAGLRVGIPSEYFVSGIDPDVERAIQEGLRSLERRGATLVEISLPHTKYAIAAYYIITPAEASSNLARFDGVHFGERGSESNSLAALYENTRSEGFGEEVKRRILVGSFVLSAGYFDAY